MPLPPEPLPEILGGWLTEPVSIGGRSFTFTRPADADALLNDPAALDRHQRDGYMPYWGRLWPVAWDMAEAVIREPWPGPLETLELGAGVGLVGLAACAAGLQVTMSDYDPLAVAACLHNARANGFAASGLTFDWRTPLESRYPLILGCEIIYESGNIPLVLGVINTMLAPGGVCWLADPGRMSGNEFPAAARNAGWHVSRRELPSVSPGSSYGRARLWIIRHAEGAKP